MAGRSDLIRQHADDVSGMPYAPIGALAGSRLPLSPIWVIGGVVYWMEHDHRQVADVLTTAGMQVVAGTVLGQRSHPDGRLNVEMDTVVVGHLVRIPDGWQPIFYARSGDVRLASQQSAMVARGAVRDAAR